MKTRGKKKRTYWSNQHLPYLIGTMVLAAILYYFPVIAGALGWTGAQNSMHNLHNLYGIDFLGLVFFVPVVYTAYVFGVIPSIVAAFIAMVCLIPQAVLIDTYPNAMFKPTAFVIILSAVGAVVAMLQKNEAEHRQRMKEMKCIYDIGKTAEETESIEAFLNNVVALIPQAMVSPEETNVRITFRDNVFASPEFKKSASKISEDLIIGGDIVGAVELYSTKANPYVKKRNHLTKTLAERISGALRQLELEHSLAHYYQSLETEVESRTKDLEQVQEKLIRSERLAAVGELASGVGHELRNPLNVIRNCAYLLDLSIAEAGDEEARDTLKTLDKQIDVANKIVTDLLDFTRIKPPAQTKVDLNTLINESLAYFTMPENVTLNSHLNGHHFQIRTDPEQISRVFTNIIGNAIQAITTKDGSLDIDTGEDDDYIWVRFRDTGCGIPAENLDKIFEPLYTTKPKGIGLGLAITKRLVDQNGGVIEVTSEVGKGTAFTVKLPSENRR